MLPTIASRLMFVCAAEATLITLLEFLRIGRSFFVSRKGAIVFTAKRTSSPSAVTVLESFRTPALLINTFKLVCLFNTCIARSETASMLDRSAVYVSISFDLKTFFLDSLIFRDYVHEARHDVLA